MLRLRSVVSITLSCWLGFLACVLGCAQPAVAAPLCEQNQIPAGRKSTPETAGSNAGDDAACCHRSRSSPGGPHQNNHSGLSCCPLDVTLIQKQDPASPFRSDTCIAVLPHLALH